MDRGTDAVSLTYCMLQGFNPGSTLGLSRGQGAVAALAAINTTIAPATAAVVMLFFSNWLTGRWDISMVNNAMLAGAVAITGGKMTCP